MTTDPKIYVWFQPHPLASAERRSVTLLGGQTVYECCAHFGCPRPAAVYHHGTLIDEKDWHSPIAEGVMHIFERVPEGGQAGAIVQGVIGVALVVAGVALQNPAMVVAGGLQIAGAGYSAYQTSEAEKISKYGRAPRPKSQSLAYDGIRNRADPYGPVPRVLGAMRAVPPFAAAPYTEIVGNTSKIMAVFALSAGPVVIDDIKIGETPISEFSAEIEYRRGYWPWQINSRGTWAPASGLPSSATFGDRWTAISSGTAGGRQFVAGQTITFNGLGAPNQITSWDVDDDKPFSLYPFDIFQDQLNLKLEHDGDFVTRTTAVNADEISVDLAFPRGLFRVSNPKGNYTQTRLDVSIRYRAVGAGAWTSLPTQRVSARQTEPHFWGYRWTVPRGQYEVSIKVGNRPETNNDTIVDETYWTTLRTHTRETATPIAGVAMLAVRLSPTTLSSGTLDELSVEVTTIARDGADWRHQPTRNPAALALDVLTAAPTRRMPDHMIDWPSFATWRDACAAQGRTYDVYVDYEQTRGEALLQIARAGYAIVGRDRRGKIRAYLDVPGKPVAALITSANSAEHSQVMDWSRVPHALRVAYIDRDAGWTAQEVLAYGDGVAPQEAEDIRQIDLPGITTRAAAYAAGRIAWAIAARRREVRSVSVFLDTPVEVLDHVLIATDTIEHMTISGIIREVILDDAGTIAAIRGDAALEWDGLEEQAFLVYGGQQIAAWPLDLTTPGVYYTFPLRIRLAADAVAVGQAYVVGPARREIKSWLVSQIEPQDQFKARLACIPYAEEIYAAADEPLPPAELRVRTRTLPAPQIVAVRSDASVMVATPSGGLEARIVISVAPVQGVPTLRTIARFRAVGSEGAWSIASRAMTDGLGVVISGVEQGTSYQIMLRHEADGWRASSWVEASSAVEVIGEAAVPQPLKDLSIVVQGSMALARWAPNTELDVLVGGRIEWRHSSAGEPYGHSVPLDVSSRGSETSALLPYRPGTYYARVFDRGGRGAEPNVVVMSGDYEIAEYGTRTTIEESDSWGGVHDSTMLRTVGGSTTLTLAGAGASWDDISNIDTVTNIDAIGVDGDFADYGVYKWARQLDLGSVKRVRVRLLIDISTIEAGDTIGLRTAPVIEWPPMSGSGQSVSADVETWCAATSDDPASPSASWSELFRIDTAHIRARGIGKIETRITARNKPLRAVVTYLGLEAAERV